MTSPSEMKTLTLLAQLIRQYGPISKFDLIIASRKSISYYEKLRPFIELYFKDIEYDKATKTWKVKVDEVIFA